MQSLRAFGFLLKDISRLFARNFERHAADFPLTLEECRVLAHLARNEGISQARLAYLTDTDPMTLGRTVERMAADGLLERRPDPQDKRARTLYLLAPATPLLRRIWRLSDLARAEAFAGLSGEDTSRLLKTLHRIHANLDAAVPGTADRGAARAKAAPRRPACS